MGEKAPSSVQGMFLYLISEQGLVGLDLGPELDLEELELQARYRHVTFGP